MRKRILLGVAVIMSLACMWDNDTIEMETKQFPGHLELITGQFPRHSSEFHHWRINDRENKLLKHPDSLFYYDDLAVSYSKLGNDSMAIELMKKKNELSPGLYTTMANLGTFYIHYGDLVKGKEFIKKAIEINPNAHFGREIVQLELVKYVLGKRSKSPAKLPLCESTRPWEYGRHRKEGNPNNFYSHLKISNVSNQAGIKGVLGMMHFGNFDSPILLEALGDLLLADNGYQDSIPRNFAAMAYLKAGIESEINYDEYLQKASVAIEAKGDSKRHLMEVKHGLEKAAKKGDKLASRIRANEIKWILNGDNPEEKYKEHYYNKTVLEFSLFEEEGSQEYQSLPKDSLNNEAIALIEKPQESTQLTKEDIIDQIPGPEEEEEKGNSLWLFLTISGAVVVIFFVVKRGINKS